MKRIQKKTHDKKQTMLKNGEVIQDAPLCFGFRC